MPNNSTYKDKILQYQIQVHKGTHSLQKVYNAVTGSPKLMNRLGTWTLLLKESCQYDTEESIPHEVRIINDTVHTKQQLCSTYNKSCKYL
jgi:hypothetical protein